ncbi:MAG TPA: universal stress protein [Bacteroidota bacterium]|nr:universal stress protein [Bacteroidota bacterium]
MMSPVKRILIPTDMSAYSLEALRYGQEISSLFDAEIIVLYVVEGKTKTPKENPEKTPDHEELKTRKHLVHFLIDHNAVLQNLRLEIRHGSPATEIVRASKDFQCDLIVLSTHGRTGLGHILLGSVAEKVVRYSGVPVLTVKPLDFVDLVDITKKDIEEDLHLN